MFTGLVNFGRVNKCLDELLESGVSENKFIELCFSLSRTRGRDKGEVKMKAKLKGTKVSSANELVNILSSLNFSRVDESLFKRRLRREMHDFLLISNVHQAYNFRLPSRLFFSFFSYCTSPD